jgi:hypothetical protein
MDGGLMTGPLAWVSYHAGETLEDTFRRSDGDECGYRIPSGLLDRLEAAERDLESAITAIKRHIEEHRIPEVDLDSEEPTGEDNPW